MSFDQVLPKFYFKNLLNLRVYKTQGIPIWTYQRICPHILGHHGQTAEKHIWKDYLEIYRLKDMQLEMVAYT